MTENKLMRSLILIEKRVPKSSSMEKKNALILKELRIRLKKTSMTIMLLYMKRSKI